MDIVVHLVRKIVNRGISLPVRYIVKDGYTDYTVTVDKSTSLDESRATRLTISGGGDKCGCCNGTGRA